MRQHPNVWYAWQRTEVALMENVRPDYSQEVSVTIQVRIYCLPFQLHKSANIKTQKTKTLPIVLHE